MPAPDDIPASEVKRAVRFFFRGLRSYHAKWRRAREARVEKCIADILGHAREHTAIVEVPPRHAGSLLATRFADAWSGIDRSVAPSPLAGAMLASTEPFSFETFREAVIRIVGMPELPPVKPWITRARAAQLEAEGVSRRMLETVFEIF